MDGHKITVIIDNEDVHPSPVAAFLEEEDAEKFTELCEEGEIYTEYWHLESVTVYSDPIKEAEEYIKEYSE